MLFYPRWFNLCVLIVSMFFVYLFILMWQRSPSISFDATVDLKELIALCVMGTLNAGHIARRTPYSVRANPELAPKIGRMVGRVISFAVQKFPGIKIVQQRSDEEENADLDSLRTNYYALWWKHRLLLEKLTSIPVSLKELSVWISPMDFLQEPTSDLAHESIMVCVAVNTRPVFGIIHRPFANETVWGIVGYGCNPNCTRIAQSRRLPLELESFYPSGHGLALIAQSGSGNAGEIIASAFGKKWKIERVNGIGYKFLRVLNGSANFYVHTVAVEKWNLCAADAIFQAAGAQLTSVNGVELTYSTEEDPTASGGFLASLDHHYYYVSRMLPILQMPANTKEYRSVDSLPLFGLQAATYSKRANLPQCCYFIELVRGQAAKWMSLTLLRIIPSTCNMAAQVSDLTAYDRYLHCEIGAEDVPVQPVEELLNVRWPAEAGVIGRSCDAL
ncbi:hypothetical protein M514_02209 [Trichuris suis]|uniref:inositol-phosphate phosphatase n=1 Tax=Trichuris suis TaxID=68888 RepID=A0A085NKQ9_9BILA|nr:hypothetical protein M513_02209 [Trichuris suis]KFD70055.1 hypothetical protein M514_02209 [Trichuris suis]